MLKSLICLNTLFLSSFGCVYESKFTITSDGRIIAQGPTWDYSDSDETGPNGWKNIKGFEHCGGDYQSPIDLPAPSAFSERLTGILPKFSDEGYEGGEKDLEFKHKGKTVEVEFKSEAFMLNDIDAYPYIVGRSPNSTAEFTLEQIHFHWGADDKTGSEHRIAGKSFPLEMHMVHYNSDIYPNVSVAAPYDDGLMVIGIFFEVSEESETDEIFGSMLEAMSSGDINLPGDDAEIELDLKAILDLADFDKFYLYPGSLTTPPCHESVTWVVLQEPLTISSEALAVFRSVQWEDETPITGNYRPIQEGNKRIVIDGATNRITTVSGTSSSETDDKVRKGKIAVPLVIVAVLVILAAILLFMQRANK